MQKLIIREPFMGVQPCEIEFDRFLLLIGEQASGKSTIAKLIYFFQSLPDVIYNSTVDAKNKGDIFDDNTHIGQVITNEFQLTFGAFRNINQYFEIDFLINEDTIKINKTEESLNIGFNWTLHEDVKNTLRQYFLSKKEDKTNGDEVNHRRYLWTELHKIFSSETNQNSYLIAGRNNIVSYTEYFEAKIQNDIEKLIEDEVKAQNLQKNIGMAMKDY